MEARIKADNKLNVVRAHAGKAEYTKREWRVVPAGFEAEAERNERLETRGAGSKPAAPETVEAKLPLPEGEPVEAAASGGSEAAAEPPPVVIDPASLNVVELRELARERDIPYSGKTKAELIEALNG